MFVERAYCEHFQAVPVGIPPMWVSRRAEVRGQTANATLFPSAPGVLGVE
jgi:hypothetical protein